MLLTTKYLDETDRLASTLAVVDAGRVIARGTPAALEASLGGGTVQVALADPDGSAPALAALVGVGAGPASVVDGLLRLPVHDPGTTLTEVVRRLDGAGVGIRGIAVLIALAVRSPEAAQSAGFVLTFPLTFASSAFVSTETMPDWLRGFADSQPVTLAADAVRALSGVGEATVWPALVWSTGLLLVLVPAAAAVYRRGR